MGTTPEIKLVEYDAGAVEAGSGDVFTVEVEDFGTVKIERWVTRHGNGVDFYDAKTGRPIESALYAVLEVRFGDRADEVFEYLSGDFLQEVADRYSKSLNDEGYFEMAKRAKAYAEATPFVLPEDKPVEPGGTEPLDIAMGGSGVLPSDDDERDALLERVKKARNAAVQHALHDDELNRIYGRFDKAELKMLAKEFEDAVAQRKAEEQR